MIEKGSVWHSVDGKAFQVITEVVIEGKEWVHYRRIESNVEEPREYSCYKESFLSRFYLQPK